MPEQTQTTIDPMVGPIGREYNSLMENAGVAPHLDPDVARYTSSVDEAAVASITKYLGVALRSTEASTVSCSDKDELVRIRESWLKKQLGLTEDDAALDASIAVVCATMKSDTRKERVTFYYLLAQRYGKLADLHAPLSMSARDDIHRIAAEHGLTYQNDGTAHLARQIENVFGNGIEPDETEQLVIAIGRAGVMDGKDLTRLHGRYLRELAAKTS